MNKPTNPYYIAYQNSPEYVEGKSFAGFINWIQARHAEYKKLTGTDSRATNYVEGFVRWLDERDS